MQDLKAALIVLALTAAACSQGAGRDSTQIGPLSPVQPPDRLGFRSGFTEFFADSDLGGDVKRHRRVIPLRDGFEEINPIGVGAFFVEQPNFSGGPIDLWRVGIKTDWPIDFSGRRDLVDGGSDNVNLGDRNHGIVPEPVSLTGFVVGLGVAAAVRRRPHR